MITFKELLNKLLERSAAAQAAFDAAKGISPDIGNVKGASKTK